MKKALLITGGAGYIGSHTAYLMARNGYKVIILDTLLHDQQFNHPWATLYKYDFADTDVLIDIFTNYKVEVVMHFAAFIEVSHSVERPSDFYQNNVVKTITLLNTMLLHGVKHFIFSSSCAVYGNPQELYLGEDHPKNPISPYGKGKLMIEYILQDYATAYDMKYVALRYFNAAGSLSEVGLGEFHIPESHLIPLVLRSCHRREPVSVFGDDYDTKDGSCVRDYVHVIDIAYAHMLAVDYLYKTGCSDVFNLGTGYGYSVKEIIDTVEKVYGKELNRIVLSRRPGDPAFLVANPTKAFTLLGWQPKCSDIHFIIKSALQWEYDNNFFPVVVNGVRLKRLNT